MTLRLYRASEVCEMADVQPYVLRSWEKEFPGIGVQKSMDGPRLYRQADVDQVLKIKALVFGEGLTVGGARRRMEVSGPPKISEAEAEEVLSTLGLDARLKVSNVRAGLKAIQTLLAHKPGEFVLEPPAPASSKSSKSTKGSKVGRGGKAVASKPQKRVGTSRAAARRPSNTKGRRASA